MGGRKMGKSTAAADSMDVEGTTQVQAPSEVQPRGTSRAVEVPSAGQPKPKKKAQQTSFKSTIYPGAFTEVHEASYLRYASCKLNPTFSNNQPTYLDSSASAPRRKTDVELRQAAIHADNALAHGHGIDHITHPYQDTGVIGSYAFQMLPYWDSQIMCNPDPAHCLANESKAIFSLVAKCKAYSPLRLSVISKYEQEVNKRWADVPTPPWLLTAENLKKATRRAECFNLKQCGYVPAPLSSIRVHLLLSTPSYLKMHEHIMCLGPVAKYILQGLLPSQQEAALFEYIDCLGNLWRRNQVTNEVGTLIEATKTGLALMEAAFPAWELDINRHSIIHVAEATSVCGPCPTFTTFVFERMWGRMSNWLSQRAYPEASMMQQYMVYKMTSQHQRRELVCDPTDRVVDSALLPGFLDDSGECRVADGEECNLSEEDNMELHLLLLRENVIPGPEGEAYREMWREYTTAIRWVDFLQKIVIIYALMHIYALNIQLMQNLQRKHVLLVYRPPHILGNWYDWIVSSGMYSAELHELAMGPKAMHIQRWDRATIKGVGFTTAAKETRGAKNSIVMVADDTMAAKMAFGRVKNFYTVHRDGWDTNVVIVQGDWHKEHRNQPMHPAIRCPVVSKMNYAKETMWYASAIQPVSIALLPYYTSEGVLNPHLWQVLSLAPDFLKRMH